MNNILIFPTDTVYGIGCRITDQAGVEEIYAIKHRDRNKPLAVLCASLAQIESIAEVNLAAKKLIETFLPGPLTLILKAKPNFTNETGLKTIGVRIPKADLALSILASEGPMFVTSVNESGETSLDDYATIVKQYGDKVKKIYPKDNVSSHLPSSVVDFTSPEIKILRQGAITLEEIKQCLGGTYANC